MGVKDEGLRRALEGDALLLEATRLRLRALTHVVSSWRWRSRLRRSGPLVREVIRAQPDVSAALERGLRRARSEAWPAGPVTRLLADVSRLESTLARWLLRRGVPADLELAEALGQLELSVLWQAHGRSVPSRRRAAAREILPRTLPSLEAAGRAAEALEAFAKTPASPLPAAAAPALARALREADAGLHDTWSRLARVDGTGAVTRFLDRRARRVPLKAPKDGPDELIRAAFWARMARARAAESLRAHLPGLTLADAEVPAALEWWAGVSPLPETWAETRRAAFALSWRLGQAQASRPACAQWPSAEWETLLGAARTAAEDPASAPLRDALSELVRAWTRRPLPVIRLPALVEAWRNAAAAAPDSARRTV